MPSTGRSSTWRRLIAISAQNAEVLVIGESSVGNATSIEGFINVDKSASSSIGHWLHQQDVDAFSQTESYGTIGDVYRIGFTGLQPLSYLLRPGSPIAQPAKDLALNLMRKGPSMYTRFHNDHLADAIFNSIATHT